MMKRQMKRPVPGKCFFCESKQEPSYLEYQVMHKFVSERGKLMGRAKTGMCAKHERAINREIKRARFVGFVPYVVRA